MSGSAIRASARVCTTRRIAAAALTALLACTQAGAQVPQPPLPPDPPPRELPEVDALDAAAAAAAPADDAALAAYVDGLVAGVMAREGIPGMLVSVVRNDRTLLAQGYGMAQLEPARPANGESTLFRIGSVSKTFTYTALMQLVEQGRVALEDPIDQHLPPHLRVPDQGFGQPIRVRHLLTHTAGFEDTALGHLFKDDPAKVESLDDYLVRWRPHRVRAPDTYAVYSNYSVALLGALVAHVSGTGFESYIEQHLTGPLGMAHTTFREPLEGDDSRRIDPQLGALIAAGYERERGAFVPGRFEHVAHAAPAGAVSTSAADMARWMRMHLNEGVLEGTRVLGEDSARSMREVLFTNAEGASGVAHGFLTEQIGGHFSYGHGGATLYFHTAMLLLPELEAGVFVSANSGNARLAVRDTARLIALRLLPPATAPAAVAPALSAVELQRYAGRYASNRRPYRSVEKLLLAPGGSAEVSVGADASLRVASAGGVVRYLPTGPNTFRAAEGDQRLVFITGNDGSVTGMVTDPAISVLERVNAWQSTPTLALLLTAATALSIGRVIGALRRHRLAPVHAPRPGLAVVKVLAVLDAMTWLAFIGTAIAAVVAMLGQGNALLFDYPSQLLVVALALATAAAVLTAFEVLALVPVWRSRWRAWPKLRYTLAVLVLAATVAAMWQWNLVGMHV